jgi:hypothetical protein
MSPMSTLPHWNFRAMHPGEMNIDPIEAEFFTTEALGSLADAFVREAIQNSLDARQPGEVLRMRVAFPSQPAMLQGERKQRYLEGLETHLRAGGAGLTELPTAEEPLNFMVVEDFGTRGLQGEPHQSEDEEIDSPRLRNDFYYFWRNIGRSRKQASELGRWGLGKTVFPAASRINSFFAVTIRADDRRRLMMGQSVLKIHKSGGRRFYPYGYYGQFDGEFALPVDEPGLVDAFCNEFCLARADQPGLSVVVPYPDAELAPAALARSIVRHYFLPIIRGDLVVDVVEGDRRTTLNATTLPTLLARAGWDDARRLQRLADLAKWGLTLPRDEYMHLDPPSESGAPRWSDACISAEAAAQLRERLNNGQRIAVTVPVWVKPAAGSPSLSQFDLCIERDEALEGAEEHYVRDGITIAGVRASLQKGMRAFVMVHDRALSQMLGDSENPAHTEWQERSPKFRDRYRHGPFTLRYVKNAPREIVRILTRPKEGRDQILLRHLFSLDVPTEETVMDPRSAREDKPGEDGSAVSQEVETVGKDRFFQLQKLRGGFRLSGLGKVESTPPKVSIRVAYETRRGNPFSQYQPPDFDLDQPPIQLRAAGAEVVRRDGNLLVLHTQKPDFQVTVKGFDVHRDVRVKIVGGEEGSEE